MSRDQDLPIAVLGAGPTGLEAALALAEAGRDFVLLEAGGRVADAMRRWGHVRLFTPWSLDVSPRMRRALGRSAPDGDECPTGDELAERVFEPLAARSEIASRLRLGHRVVEIGRQGLLKHESIGGGERRARPFRLLVDAPGGEEVVLASAVIDATGTYYHPNALGDGGVPALGERAAGTRIARHLPDLERDAELWAGRKILLVGGGHSAQTAARDLAAFADRHPGTEVVWALRGARRGWAKDDDALPSRAALARDAEALADGAHPAIRALRGVVVDRIETPDGTGAPLRVHLRASSNGGAESGETVEADRVLALTGYAPDRDLYRQLQVHECYATSGPIQLAAALLGEGSDDCLEVGAHGAETLRNPEPGFFIVGIKSYGRTNTFLMRNGWQQVDDVLSLLA